MYYKSDFNIVKGLGYFIGLVLFFSILYFILTKTGVINIRYYYALIAAAGLFILITIIKKVTGRW